MMSFKKLVLFTALNFAAIAPLAVIGGTSAVADTKVSAAQLEKNKQIVLGMTAAMAEKNIDKSASFLADGYIQHNPMVPTSKAGFVGFFTPIWAGKQMPAHPLDNPPVELVAEGDMVVAIFRTPTPDPVDPTKMYDSFNFDAYRVVDGKIVEHWDGYKRRAPAAPPAAAPAATK